MKLLAILCILAFAAPVMADDSTCRVFEGNMRIETAEDAAALDNVCEVTGGLGIFPETDEVLTFPNIEKIGLINISSVELKAIAFPKLKSARRLYIKGASLEAVEFPQLRRVGNLLVKTRTLQYLHFPKLGTVRSLNMQGNLDLECVFADNLYDVSESLIENNPLMAKGCRDVLLAVTRIFTEEEIEARRQAREEIREIKRRQLDDAYNQQPPPPPTGHTTYIGGWEAYRLNYRTYYWNYWQNVRYYSFDRYYPYWYRW